MSSPQTRCETRNSHVYWPECCIVRRFFQRLHLCFASPWVKWPTLSCSAAIASSRSVCSQLDINFVSRFWSRHCARRYSRACNRRGRLQIEPLKQRVKIRFVDGQSWTRGRKLLAFIECLK